MALVPVSCSYTYLRYEYSRCALCIPDFGQMKFSLCVCVCARGRVRARDMYIIQSLLCQCDGLSHKYSQFLSLAGRILLLKLYVILF